MSSINGLKFIPRGISSLSVFRYSLFSSFKIKGLCNNKTNIAYFNSTSLRQPQSSKYVRISKSVGIGLGIGAALSGLYLFGNYYRKVNNHTSVLNTLSGEEYYLRECPPKHHITHTVQSPADKSGFKITLYQYQTCPFCCKVRTFLDYYGFTYDVVEVNPFSHRQTKWSNYRKVPFLVIEQQGTETVMQLKDSSMIISALQSFICNKNQSLEEIVKYYPIFCVTDEAGNKNNEIQNKYALMCGDTSLDKPKEEIILERKWRKWTDEVYIHLLSPNIYRTVDEAFQAFQWLSEVGNWEKHFQLWERLLGLYVGSYAMYFIGKKLKKKYQLKDDVRISLYDETRTWLKEVKKRGGKFLGGNEPNLSDLGIYGVLSAIEGCDAFQDLVNNTNIQTWYSNVKEAVRNHQGSKYLTQRGANKV